MKNIFIISALLIAISSCGSRSDDSGQSAISSTSQPSADGAPMSRDRDMPWARCGAIRCFDHCLRGMVTLQGDRCSLEWDVGRNCQRAVASCGAQPINRCTFKPCFDQCAGTYVMLRVNQCGLARDPIRGCMRATGTCY